MKTIYTITDHRNDIGDWCPWSLCNVTEEYYINEPDEERCPAGCRASSIELSEEKEEVA